MDVSRLAGLPLFAGLSPQQLETIAQHAEEIEAPAGKALMSDGALAWDFYVIVDGTAEARHGTTTFRTLGPGDFFGEIGVMAADRRRTASVVTTSPVRAVKLTTHQVRAIADAMPEVAERLRTEIADREQRLL